MSNLFWDIYAKTYDIATLNFSAYLDILEVLEKDIKLENGDIVLNAGCGSGNLENIIKNRSEDFKWIGVDISREMLAMAKKKISDSRFTFSKVDLDNILDIEDNSISTIISVHSLYTTKDPNFTISEFGRILNSKGQLIIVNPKKGADMRKMFKYEFKRKGLLKFLLLLIRVIPALVINLIIAKMASSNRYHFLSKEELGSILSNNGFRITKSDLVYAGQSLLLISRKNE